MVNILKQMVNMKVTKKQIENILHLYNINNPNNVIEISNKESETNIINAFDLFLFHYYF